MKQEAYTSKSDIRNDVRSFGSLHCRLPAFLTLTEKVRWVSTSIVLSLATVGCFRDADALIHAGPRYLH